MGRFLFRVYRAVALGVTGVFFALWLWAAAKQIPVYVRDCRETLSNFIDIKSEVSATYRIDPAHLTPAQLKMRTVIDPTYMAFLEREFPGNFPQIMRELIAVDFRYPVTKAAYVIQSQRPARGSTILMFSQVEWMVDWCAAKFFEYNWVNVAAPAHLGDSTPTQTRVYRQNDLPEILAAVAKYRPSYIVAHNAFTKVLVIPGFSPLYVLPDRTYGWTILYRANEQ
jgi:hypothetical protein